MEQDIANNRYLECGELQGHLYGTKLDSIRNIIRSGKMCIIDCNPQCLKLLKTKEFMPFVVFIAAPSIDQLRYMHEWGRSHGLYGQTGTGTIGRTYTVRVCVLVVVVVVAVVATVTVTISRVHVHESEQCFPVAVSLLETLYRLALLACAAIRRVLL